MMPEDIADILIAKYEKNSNQTYEEIEKFLYSQLSKIEIKDGENKGKKIRQVTIQEQNEERLNRDA